MNNSKIVTMRFPEPLLERFNEFCGNYGHCSRSFAVIQLLDTVFACAEPETILEMIVKRYPREKGYVVRFEVEKGKIAERLAAEKADKT